MKTEKRAETMQFSIKLKSLEREIEGFLTRFSNQGIVTNNYLANLEDCSDVLGISRLDDRLELDRKLVELKLSIRRLTFMIANPSNNTGKDYLHKVKCLMELIESKILVFKAEQIERMSELDQAERMCFQDIRMLEEKISKADYNDLDVSKTGSSVTSDVHFSYDKNASGLLPPVADFQNFVAKYGHENGWDPSNHTAFVKLRKKYGHGTEALYNACEKRLLHVSYQMAVDHDSWYTMYEEKSNAHKSAIQKWKHAKKVEVSTTQSLKDQEKEQNPKIKENNEEDLRKQKDREFKKYQLALWKKEQERIKKEKEELEKKQTEIQKEKRKKEILERKMERELKMKDRQKKAQEKRIQPQDGIQKADARNRMNNILVLALQREREEQVLKKRKEIIKRKKDEEIQKEARLNRLKETVKVTVSKDPERLFKPTKGFIQKSSSNETLVHESSRSSNYSNIQRRAIPLWRSEL